MAIDGGRQIEKRRNPATVADIVPALNKRWLPGPALCMLILLLAMMLGGGGTVNPQTEMVLQVLIALTMIPLVGSVRWQHGLGPVHPGAWLLAALILVLPVAQLIPLPPSLWQALPNRSIEAQALAAAGAVGVWMPLSMAPARTFASLIAMICPVLVMIQVSRLSLQGRTLLCAAIIGGGILSLILGVLQLSQTGGWNWSLYNQYSEGFLVGFQANRNAECDVLMIALLAIGVLGAVRLDDGRQHLLTMGVVALGLPAFLVGVLMTGSRTGIALLLPAALVLFGIFWPVLHRRINMLRWFGGVLILLALTATTLAQLQSVQKVIARFSITTEARWDLWADTWYAIGQVWPFGSGIGTIVPMLEAAERLDVVDMTSPVRAHNDWLEWTLEAGLPGLVVLGIVILVIGWFAVRAIISSNRAGVAPARRAQVAFGTGVLIIEGLHAIVDYPMRSMALAILSATALAFLFEPTASQRNEP
ncbi:O-antigen ligase family protein [Novosphingobium fuchskuhlense]|nr:O-antigen ligase family protein [Novosphingobium fuchskuhlense]